MGLLSRRWRLGGSLRVFACLGTAASVILVTISCSTTQRDPAVVSVGSVSIDAHSIDHWTHMIARGAIVANVADPNASAKQQALALLIYSNWLTGEASRVRLKLPRRQLERTIERQERSMPSGPSEFRELLAASGETSADVEFETRARWAASALARRVASLAAAQARAQVTGDVVARFYRAHEARYHLRERRYYDLIEHLPSKRHALALAKRLGTGRRFAERASEERPFRPKTFARLPGQAVVYRAVFHAKVGALTGPLPLQGTYALFVLRRIEPRRVQPLVEVRASIESRLLALAAARARARILDDFHRRWAARTNCRPGYIVQKCKQYTGPAVTEHNPLADY